MFDVDTLGFDRAHIVVLGDVMLDAYIVGAVDRISPEAPVPVLRQVEYRSVAGAAANVACNIAALGGHVSLIAPVGADEQADTLAAEVKQRGISFVPIVDPLRPTIVKTRVMAGGHQLVRIDREITGPVPSPLAKRLVAATRAALQGAGVLVLSDYGKGCLSDAVLEGVIADAQARGIPILVDPKRIDFTGYRGATLIKPNRLELSRATGRDCSRDDDAEIAAQMMITATGSDILLTRSERGMSLFRAKSAPVHVESRVQEVFDVSGAGDTVIATLALGIAAQLPIEQAIRIANHAAGIVISKPGTAIVSPEELAASLDGERASKIEIIGAASRQEAIEFRVACAKRGMTVGFTNGCFDLIHPGHIRLIRAAAAECDQLIVALNTDASVSRLKGASRPLQSEQNRAIVIGALADVALVTLFDEDTPRELIEALQPDVLIKGADYTEDQIVGADFVKMRGGRVHRVNLVEGQSTTALVDKGAALKEAAPKEVVDAGE